MGHLMKSATILTLAWIFEQQVLKFIFDAIFDIEAEIDDIIRTW